MTTERGFRDKVFGGRLYLEAADRRLWRLNIDLLDEHLCVNYKMSMEHGTIVIIVIIVIIVTIVTETYFIGRFDLEIGRA